MIGVEEAKKLAPILCISAAYILTLEDAPLNTKEDFLMKLYRQSDNRGKDAILRVAESQSAYSVSDNNSDTDKTGTK